MRVALAQVDFLLSSNLEANLAALRQEVCTCDMGQLTEDNAYPP